MRRLRLRIPGFCLLCALLCLPLSALPLQKDQGRRQEESEDYFKKWLDQDVVYIITDEERKVFRNLSTPEEREQFVEQFWYRRDPDPRTAANEFKEEHYRRIAYANERFASGLPGWMSDRGRIYIIHGEPAEIESRPTGGTVQRPVHEGGGETSTYAHEVWRYRYVEGLGQDIVLEFVDPTSSGEYRLALNPEEKDALLHVPGAGLTTAEQLGLASKADRPYFSPGNRESYPLASLRARDNPFERYRTFSQIQAPQEIKFKDLKQLVEVNVSFENLPFLVRSDYYRLNEFQVLVPLTLQVRNQDLTFELRDGAYFARVAVYGAVTSITNRLAAEFEEELAIAYPADVFEVARLNSSSYQRILSLEQRLRYKVDLVVKDLISGNTGVVRAAVAAPRFPEDQLSLSSLVVSDSIRILDQIPEGNAMFVIGDVKIRPSLDNSFRTGNPIGIYCHLYNAGVDQTTLAPSLRIRYEVYKEGEPVGEALDESGESIQLASGMRVVLVRQLPIRDWMPGEYEIRLEVEDRIRGENVASRQKFTVVEAPR